MSEQTTEPKEELKDETPTVTSSEGESQLVANDSDVSIYADEDKHNEELEKILDIYKGEIKVHRDAVLGYYKTLMFEIKDQMLRTGKDHKTFLEVAMGYFRDVVSKHDLDKLEDAEMCKYLALRHYNHLTLGRFKLSYDEIEKGEYYIRKHREENLHHVEFGMYNMAKGNLFGEQQVPYVYTIYTMMEIVADWCAVAEELGVDPIKWFGNMVNKRKYVVPDYAEKQLIEYMRMLKPFLEENRKLGRFGLHQPDHCTD
jgi:hypothetical protein